MQRGRDTMIIVLFCPAEPSQKCTGWGGGERFEPQPCKATSGFFYSVTTSHKITEHWFVPLESEKWPGLLSSSSCLP